MDSQPHPLLHVLIWMKQTSTNVFLQVAKNVEIIRGKIWIVRRMLKCFPAKSLKLIPHQIGSMGTGVVMQKYDSVWQHYRAFWLYGASQHPQLPGNKPHLSALLCWMNTLYTTLTSRAIKKQLCGPVRFRYACLLLYRWQYRYVTTVLSTFARNVLWRVFSFHLTAPYIFCKD